MNSLIETVQNIKKKSNGSNGLMAKLKGEVCARGLKHRVFMSEHDRLEEAADVVTPVRPYTPTLAETAARYGVSTTELRVHLKWRAAEQSLQQQQDLLELFLDTWRRMSESTKVQAFKDIGPVQVWEVLAEVIA